MTEQEINNLIDSKIGKTKMSQLPEATQTSGLYSIGYTGSQSVKYKANLLQGDPLTVRKTYQTEAEALADKNPIDATTSLPLKIGQFVSIVDDGEKNGIYRIGSISGDGTMSLELQGKLGDLSDYAKKEEIKNAELNGNFSDLSGWWFDSGITNQTATNNILSFTGSGNTGIITNRVSSNSFPDGVGYARVLARGINGGETLYLGRGNSQIPIEYTLSTSFEQYSGIFDYESSRFVMGAGNGDNIEVKEVIITEGVFEKEVFDSILLNSEWFIRKEITLFDILEVSSETINIKADHGYLPTEEVKTLKEVEDLSLYKQKTVENIEYNGNWDYGLSGWEVREGITDASVVEGILSFVGGGNLNNTTNFITRNHSLGNTDLAYIRIEAKAESEGSLYIGRGLNTIQDGSFQLTNEYESYSVISSNPSVRIKFGGSAGDRILVKNIMIVNLSQNFDVIPNKNTLDNTISEWFSDTKIIKIIDDNLNAQLYDIEDNVELLNNQVRGITDNIELRSIKVLLIGSSFGVDAIQHFPILAKKAGVDVVAGNIYQGGLRLNQILEKCETGENFEWYAESDGTNWARLGGDKNVIRALNAHDWDIIILQRGARASHTWTPEQRDSLFGIIDFINDNTDYHPKILFNTCHSFPVNDIEPTTRQQQKDKTDLINSSTLEMQADVFLDFIPNNTAIQNARNTFLTNYGSADDKDLARDYLHLDSGIGNYITGCVMFEKILGERFGMSVRTLDFVPSIEEIQGLLGSVATYTPVTSKMAKVAKLSALAAIQSPLEVSDSLEINFGVE